MTTINPIWSGGWLGEGPLWHAEEQALYWVDIAQKQLHRLQWQSQLHQQWSMPDFIGCIAPRKSGGLIAGIGPHLATIDLPSGDVSILHTFADGLRLNDGKCDRQGRFWFGSAQPNAPEAKLYRYDPDGTLTTMEEGIYISNGLGWSPDNRYFYYTDSVARTIWRYDFNPNTGEICNRIVWVELSEADGFPDGLTVDAEGFVWSACWEGQQVVRYAPSGKSDRVIPMPVARPTSCMFGGPKLTTLFVTSCSRDVTETDALPEPAGSLFAIETVSKGLIEPSFGG